MANRFRGEVTAQAGGVDYTLVLDFNAMCAFESATGMNSFEFLAGVQSGVLPSASQLRALVWASLKKLNPHATVDTAGDLLTEDESLFSRIVAAVEPEPGRGKKA